jgi:hypothetical protein
MKKEKDRNFPERLNCFMPVGVIERIHVLAKSQGTQMSSWIRQTLLVNLAAEEQKMVK